jgi:hypothetical protein
MKTARSRRAWAYALKIGVFFNAFWGYVKNRNVSLSAVFAELICLKECGVEHGDCKFGKVCRITFLCHERRELVALDDFVEEVAMGLLCACYGIGLGESQGSDVNLLAVYLA